MNRIDLPEIKIIVTDILRYIDRVCRENDIRYYIMFGTLIGAVRHKGFIPWDDDIDICIFREDYERFIKAINTNSHIYGYIGFETDPYYYFTYGRVIDRRTILTNRPKRDIKDFGLFVDVFPMDNIADSESLQHTFFERFTFYRNRVWKTIPTRYNDVNKPFLLRFKRWLREMPARFKLGVSNFGKYREMYIASLQTYKNDSCDYITIAETYKKCVFPKKYFENSIDIQFEDLVVKAPACYHEILSETYGNYMVLPPKDQQITNHEFIAYWK